MMELDLTYADIEKKLRAFPDLVDITSDVSDMIDEENQILSTVVCMQGIDPTTVTATVHVRLRSICRTIVKLRVSAELLEELSHEESKLANARRKRADKLEAMIRSNVEAVTTDYDPETMRGTWDYDIDDTRQSSGLYMDWSTVRGG